MRRWVTHWLRVLRTRPAWGQLRAPITEREAAATVRPAGNVDVLAGEETRRRHLRLLP